MSEHGDDPKRSDHLRFTRQTTPTDPDKPLSLASQLDQMTINNRVYTTAFTAATLRCANSSAAGRPSASVIDQLGRVTQTQAGNLNPVSFSYDSNGRLSSVTQGTRTTSFAYGSDGRLSQITDAMVDVPREI